MSSSIIISISTTLVYYTVLFFLNKKSQVIHLNKKNERNEVFGSTTAVPVIPSENEIQDIIQNIEIVLDPAEFQDAEIEKDPLQDTTNKSASSATPDNLNRFNETSVKFEDYKEVLSSANELSKGMVLDVNKDEVIESLHFMNQDSNLKMDRIEFIVQELIRKKSKVVATEQKNHPQEVNENIKDNSIKLNVA